MQEESTSLLEFDGYVDLGKELSILHSLLIETLDKVFALQVLLWPPVAVFTFLF
jgi:hypothetical protein